MHGGEGEPWTLFRLVVVAIPVLVLVAPAAGAGGGTSFRLSPIQAASVSNEQATTYSVTVTGVPASLEPNFRWTLYPATAACTDAQLAGGRRATAGGIVWLDQGTTFVWHWSGGRPCAGTVTVTAENEYEHCHARLDASGGSQRGPPAVCALGGYTLPAGVLPVPAGLLRSAAAVAAGLARLASGSASPAQIAAVAAARDAAFAHYFPPVLGCPFARLFEPLVAAGTSGDYAAGARAARSCSRQADTLASSLAGLGVRHATRAAFFALLDRRLPRVFGSSYSTLVRRVMAENRALLAARGAAAEHRGEAAAAAVASAAKLAQATHSGLVAEQRRVEKIENANG